MGAGVYRAATTVAMTSPTVTTNIIGDVDGALTGDAGEVRFSASTTNEWMAPVFGCLDLAGRNFLKFSNIVFTGAANVIQTGDATNYTFSNCAILLTGNTAGHAFKATSTTASARNGLIDSCIITGAPATSSGSAAGVDFVLVRTAADYDANIIVKNCRIVSGTNAVRVESSGAGVGFGGGVLVYNCYLYAQAAMDVGASIATSVPCKVYNSVLQGNSALTANASGQITEDYNVMYAATARTNVTAGAHSVVNQYPLGISWGQEAIWGGQVRPPGTPTADSVLLGFGAQAGGPAVDILNRNRPSGMRLVASGTATAGAAKTLTDSGATWGVNAWAGYTLLLTGGTGSGQTKSIASNTGTVLTLDGNWKTNPDNTSTYQVSWGDLSSTGKATSGSTTTLTDSNAAWGTNQWAGYTLHTDAGTGSGQSLTVVSNTATAITFATATAPDSTTTYSLYKATSTTTQDYAVGAYERHDHYERETTTTDAGGVGLRVLGSGDQEIKIPVTATSTVISVKVRWHTAASNKPQATLLANGEIGVTAETVTATGGVDSWEVLTFAAQSPTAVGVVTVRLIARPDASADITYADSLAVA